MWLKQTLLKTTFFLFKKTSSKIEKLVVPLNPESTNPNFNAKKP